MPHNTKLKTSGHGYRSSVKLKKRKNWQHAKTASSVAAIYVIPVLASLALASGVTAYYFISHSQQHYDQQQTEQR